jgi:hypothetical protein
LKPEDRGTIREALRAPWNLDDPIETIWTRTNEVLRALLLTEPVPESAVIRDLLFVFETTGVFPRACEAWREKDNTTQTMDGLRDHFTRYNEERVRNLTAKQAGYHLVSTPNTPSTGPTETANAATTSSSELPHITTNNMVKMFYCWTHGLGTNPKHCSSTCKKKGPGHINTATADNMEGGNDKIMKPYAARAGHITP